MQKNEDFILTFWDSELEAPEYLPDQEILRICCTLWNAKKAEIVFEEAIAFCFLANHSFVGMQIADEGSGLLTSALKLYFDRTIPADHGFHCYEFLDCDDDVCIKVVAKKYHFIQE